MTHVTYIISDINKSLAFEWISNYINANKFRLSFILLNNSNSELEDFLIRKKIPVQCIKVTGKKNWLKAWITMYRTLKKQKPDAVHCHLLIAGLLGLSAAKAAGIRKRFYTRHHADLHYRYYPSGIKWDKMCNYFATKVIAPSPSVIHILTKYEKVDLGKIILIPHGFDLDYFRNVSEEIKQQFRNKYNPYNQYPVIGVISRFIELKGIQYIIPAFKKILNQYPDALLMFFGTSGDYTAEIDKLLLDIPKQNYFKIPFENNLAGIYTLFDIFIQVSIDTTIESFGQTYVEALAAGIPSIFTLSGIAPFFIEDKKNAIVVPFKDSMSIYSAIHTLLNDKKLSIQLRQQGWKSVKDKFEIQGMVNALENAYVE